MATENAKSNLPVCMAMHFKTVTLDSNGRYKRPYHALFVCSREMYVAEAQNGFAQVSSKAFYIINDYIADIYGTPHYFIELKKTFFRQISNHTTVKQAN